MLSDLGIGGDEVLLLAPSAEGTRMDSVSSIKHVRSFLESEMGIAEAAQPLTEPPMVQQLDLFE